MLTLIQICRINFKHVQCMIFLPWEGGEQWDGTRFHPRTSPPHRTRRQPQGRSRTRTSQTPQNKTHHFLLPIHICGLCKNSFDHKGCHKCRLFMLKTQPAVTYFNQKEDILLPPVPWKIRVTCKSKVLSC